MARLLTHTDALQELCKASGKFGMYIAIHAPDPNFPAWGAATYLRTSSEEWNALQVQADGSGFLLFENEEEMWRYYERTVGDDGPTKLNTYTGPSTVYALTCSDKGELGTENT